MDNNMKERLLRNRRQTIFYVTKDGINFCFKRLQDTGNVLADFFLDSVALKVRILPEKHKSIKNPTHFYGELVKTKQGANYLRETRHLDKFKADVIDAKTSTL